MLLRDCIEVYQAFTKLSSLTLPFKSSWMIAQNLNKLKPIVEGFDEARKAYADKLRDQSPKDDDGNLQINDELVAEFQQHVVELLSEEHKIRLKKVTLFDSDELTIEPASLVAAMDYLILEDNADKGS